ncbi:MAG: four-carbon acid sugar kinase family protein [Betaproteobacteria bacterium]|nr:MAG: four-carbon acid sugar kinase family protein [Betaproteobacteria bacterium]
MCSRGSPSCPSSARRSRSCPGCCRCSARCSCAPSCPRSCSGCRNGFSEAIACVLILADDLTGAADCAAAFLGRAARVAVALDAGALPRAAVVAIDLDTRRRSERAARRIVREALAGRAAQRRGILFKKIDSTLRGHVVAELAAARAALGPRRPVIFAPAFPAQRRVVRNGRVYVQRKALGGDVCEALARSGIEILDAATDVELDAIARHGLAMRPRPLFVGSAGLAKALARTLPRRRPAKATIEPRPVVSVVGSASPVSARQAQRLSRSKPARSAHVLLQIESSRMPEAIDRTLARRLGRLVARLAPHAHYVLTGGETARAVLGALRVSGLRLLGEIEPGVPFGITPDGALVCTKAGAFGSPDTLTRCVARLQREMR